MATNRSHNSESAQARLDRFRNGKPTESIETLLNSIACFLIMKYPSHHKLTHHKHLYYLWEFMRCH